MPGDKAIRKLWGVSSLFSSLFREWGVGGEVSLKLPLKLSRGAAIVTKE